MSWGLFKLSYILPVYAWCTYVMRCVVSEFLIPYTAYLKTFLYYRHPRASICESPGGQHPLLLTECVYDLSK